MNPPESPTITGIDLNARVVTLPAESSAHERPRSISYLLCILGICGLMGALRLAQFHTDLLILPTVAAVVLLSFGIRMFINHHKDGQKWLISHFRTAFPDAPVTDKELKYLRSGDIIHTQQGDYQCLQAGHSLDAGFTVIFIPNQ